MEEALSAAGLAGCESLDGEGYGYEYFGEGLSGEYFGTEGLGSEYVGCEDLAGERLVCEGFGSEDRAGEGRDGEHLAGPCLPDDGLATCDLSSDYSVGVSDVASERTPVAWPHAVSDGLSGRDLGGDLSGSEGGDASLLIPVERPDADEDLWTPSASEEEEDYEEDMGDEAEMPSVRPSKTFRALAEPDQEEAPLDLPALEIDHEAMRVVIQSITQAVDFGQKSPGLRRGMPLRPPAMPSPPATPRVARPDGDARMVRLKVYDLTHLQFIEGFNSLGMKLGIGGLFHVTIEVYNQEWSYGYSDYGSGVVCGVPGKETGHHFRRSLDLGPTPLSRSECKCMMMDLAFTDDWHGQNYDIIRHNCTHFARTAAAELGARPLPDWVDRFSRTAERLVAQPNDVVKEEPEMVEVHSLPASFRVSFKMMSGDGLEHCITSRHVRLSL